MGATQDQAEFVFIEWHDRIRRRDATALSALYTDDAVLESPLVCRVLDTPRGIVAGRDELDRFLTEITRRRPSEDELPALYRTGTYLFDGETLIWEYPRTTGGGVDQLDLVEVMELDGPLIRCHRVYWGWCGTEHVIANAVGKAAPNVDAGQYDKL
ncbi:nuclear transport factor 2 family protein [Rhodococcoides fascians A25f]|uniref:hypothetical protein n=1 Tax=Rhodococcoides fascians TaxID=1828 RepID=UPI00068A6AE8|nr:hypothetical protein [Rhodococcus fascians]QII06242.1 nuclear transport factor 2 family protein [Rhodococcus fascians A25f]